jgi:hypothetical protein
MNTDQAVTLVSYQIDGREQMRHRRLEMIYEKTKIINHTVLPPPPLSPNPSQKTVRRTSMQISTGCSPRRKYGAGVGEVLST